MKNLNILVMDDCAVNRKAAAVLLKDHTVVTVENFDQAVEALESRKFDVVLTDLLLPPFVRGHEWKKFVGQEIAFGAVVALHALAKGVKMVAIVTDANHHDHPAAATLDYPVGGKTTVIGDARLVCINDAAFYFKEETYESVGSFSEAYEFPHIEGTGDKQGCIVGFKGLVKGKAWHWALENLLQKK